MFYSWHIIHCSCKSAQMPIRSLNEFKWNNGIYLAEILLTVCFLCWSLLLRVLVAPKGAVVFVWSFDVFQFFFFFIFFIPVFYFGSRYSCFEISSEIHQASMDDIKVKPVVFFSFQVCYHEVSLSCPFLHLFVVSSPKLGQHNPLGG